MPPIYRHVVPNVPAWTAGNGSPCYRGDAPSCQALMEFNTGWRGNLDLTPWYNHEYTDPADQPTFRSLALSETSINAAIAHYTSGLGTRTHYNTGTPHAADNGLPPGAWVEYDLVNGSGDYNIYEDGVLVMRIRGLSLVVGLEWDGGNTYWRWFARLTRFILEVFGESDGAAASPDISLIGATGHYAYYATGQLTSSIRVGNGKNMPFAGIYNEASFDAWRHAVLANTALVVAAQYA